MKNSVLTTKLIKESGKSYLEIPEQMLKDIGAIESSKVFMTVIDGIIQCSFSEPYTCISLLTLDAKKHVPLKV